MLRSDGQHHLLLIDLALLAGLEASRNLGEQRLSGLAQLSLRSQHVVARTQFNTSDKIESGAGYIVAADVDLLHGPLAAGVGYRYRDGGYWIKRSLWARGGLAWPAGSVTLAADLTTESRVRQLELTARAARGPLLVEYQAGPLTYQQAGRRHWGLRAAVLLGIGR